MSGDTESISVVTLRRPGVSFPAVIALCVLSVASLALITTVDDIAYRFTVSHRSFLAMLAEIRLPSLILCTILALLIRPAAAQETGLDSARWPKPFVIAVYWLLGTTIAVFMLRVYVPPLPRRVDVVALLFTGLVAEECLFRGALFGLAARAFPGRPVTVIVWTSLFFSAQHFQYHHFAVTRNALTQVAYAFPLGLVLGYVRTRTGSLGAPVALHFVNNLLSVVRVTLG